MTDAAEVSIESLNEDVMEFYSRSGMERGRAGTQAIEWAFSGNDMPFAVARQRGRIVGISSYIQSAMQFGHYRGRGLQAVDSFVSEEARGMGLFTSLARKYAEHARRINADLVWGFPNDNAAPAWFAKLGWSSHGQVPFMVKPLRAGYFMRKLKLPIDFPIALGSDEDLAEVADVGDWADNLWAEFAVTIGCATIRDQSSLRRRFFERPGSNAYRIVADPSPRGAIVVTLQVEKHGGHIAYLVEAMGGTTLPIILRSELARLRDRGVELILAWCYPWSPNHGALRRCGFLPLPERLRPIRIWFGGTSYSIHGEVAMLRRNWYVSYFDSDTI